MKQTLFMLLMVLLLAVPKSRAQVLTVAFEKLTVDSLEVGSALTGPTGYKTIVVNAEVTPSTPQYRLDYVKVTAMYKSSTGQVYNVETQYPTLQSEYRLNRKLYFPDKTGQLAVTIEGWYSKINAQDDGPIIAAASKIVVFAVALPVELLSFDVRGTKAYWTTASEVDAARFEVQTSNGDNKWQTLATVPAKGAGNYVAALPTRFGLNYYRLKSIDHDGTVAYSPVRAVDGSAEDAPVSASYYDFQGRSIPKPFNGFYIEVLTRQSGAVERHKVYQE